MVIIFIQENNFLVVRMILVEYKTLLAQLDFWKLQNTEHNAVPVTLIGANQYFHQTIIN